MEMSNFDFWLLNRFGWWALWYPSCVMWLAVLALIVFTWPPDWLDLGIVAAVFFSSSVHAYKLRQLTRADAAARAAEAQEQESDHGCSS